MKRRLTMIGLGLALLVSLAVLGAFLGGTKPGTIDGEPDEAVEETKRGIADNEMDATGAPGHLGTAADLREALGFLDGDPDTATDERRGRYLRFRHWEVTADVFANSPSAPVRRVEVFVPEESGGMKSALMVVKKLVGTINGQTGRATDTPGLEDWLDEFVRQWGGQLEGAAEAFGRAFVEVKHTGRGRCLLAITPTPPGFKSRRERSGSEAEPLRARVGTAGEGTGSAIARARYNESITRLKASKRMEDGLLILEFEFDNPRCPQCQFLIRLFDKNGNYLTHFVSEEHHELGFFDTITTGNPERLTLRYQVNTVHLEAASIVEFGFAPVR